MSKRVRSLIIVGVVTVALVGVLAALLLLVPENAGESSEPESTADLSVELIDKTIGADGATVSKPVKKAVFTARDETFTLVQSADGDMVVEAFSDLPRATFTIDALVSYLSDMTAVKMVVENSDNQSDFGFDNPETKIEVTYHDDSVSYIEVGDETPTKSGHYVRMGKSGPIYIVDSSSTNAFLQKAVAYIGTEIMTAPETDSADQTQAAVMYSVTLGGTSREKEMVMRIKKEGDDADLANYSHIMTAPYLTGTNMNTTAPVVSLSNTTSFTATKAVEAHPSKEKLKEYGLDKPFSTAEFCLAVQTTPTEEDAVPSYSKFVYYKFLLGNKDEDGNYYVMCSNIDAVYLCSEMTAFWAKTKWDELATNMLFLIDITTISGISVDVNGQTTDFKLAHYPEEEERDDMMTVTTGDKVYATDHFRSLYQVFMMATRYGPLEKTPSGIPEITISIKRTSSDLKDRVIRFYKQDASLYACVAEGGESYSVKNSDVAFLKLQIQNYLDGKKVETK